MALPKNFKSKKAYRGVNIWMLCATSMLKGYTSRYWLTYKQAQGAGGHVKKGEKATPVCYFQWIKPKAKKGEEQDTNKRIPLLRWFSVFNIDQCEGVERPEDDINLEPKEDSGFSPIEVCEQVMDAMPKRPEVKHLEQRAYYRPSTDTINMPKPESFEVPEEYYSTLFHEAGHSTGHASRVGRKGVEEATYFGSESYSKEELVAEMTAAFLCGHCGIENRTIDNSAAYIQNWLAKLSGDKRLVVHAAAQAQKATDYILGVTWEKEDDKKEN
jgi:antirestriction protein ArdC